MLAQFHAWHAAADAATRVRVRERSMADNVMRILLHQGQGARAVVWAHDDHIAGNVEGEPRMMGVELRARLGAAYFAIGTAIDRGAYRAQDELRRLHDFPIRAAAPGSVEDAFFATGRPIALLDLHTLPASGVAANWFDALQITRTYDGLYDDETPPDWGARRIVVSREYDALLFLATGTVPHGLPLAHP